MSYSTDLLKEDVETNFLGIMRPRTYASGFSLFSGTVYVCSFTSGYVYSVEVNGAAYTAQTSTSLSVGQYYFDFGNQKIYINAGGAPVTNSVVALYEIYFATKPCYWYRLPTDTTTDVVYFGKLIQTAPIIRDSLSDVIFGSVPSQSLSIDVLDGDRELEPLLYSSSFSNAVFDIYHATGSLKKPDMNQVSFFYSALVNQIIYNERTVSFSLLDRFQIFNNEFRSAGGTFLSAANVSPISLNFPIRTVYGRVEGFIFTDSDYNADTPTTSNNRVWTVQSGTSASVPFLVLLSTNVLNTTTRTYTSSPATKVTVGDRIWMNVAASDQYPLVTAINNAGGYFDHTAISVPATTGDVIKLARTLPRVFIIQKGVKYEAYPNRDYLLVAGTSPVQIRFASTLEANTGMPDTLSPSDLVYGTVGSIFSITVNAYLYTGLVAVLLDLLLKAGVSSSSIDDTSFQSVASAVTDSIGFAVPGSVQEGAPDIKTVMTDVLFTGLLKLYINGSGKWALSRIAPISSTDQTVSDDDITEDSFSYEFDFSELYSDVLLQYNFQEVTDATLEQGQYYDTVTAQSSAGVYLHKVTKTKTFTSLHNSSADAQTLANRLSYIVGSAKGLIKLTGKTPLLPLTIGNKLTISRSRMPGTSFTDGVSQTRDAAMVESNRSMNQMQIVLDDQKGIQDNSGSW